MVGPGGAATSSFFNHLVCPARPSKATAGKGLFVKLSSASALAIPVSVMSGASRRRGAGSHGMMRRAVDVRAIAAALGGQVSGRDTVLAPGPGHSPRDRSLAVRLDPTAPDGFLTFSHAGDGWQA